MKLDDLAALSCPYCGNRLAVERAIATHGDEIVQGIVQCGCYRYPLIDGILILKQLSGAADTDDPRVAHLLANEVDLARQRAMNIDAHGAAPGAAWRRRLRKLAAPILGAAHSPYPDHLRQPGGDGSTEFVRRLQALRPGLYGDYLYQRYANNSFLASIPPLLLLGDLAPGERVLELACGVGHSAYLIRALFPHLRLVATDHDFVNLVIAREHFVPDATLMCIDAEAPLPFDDRSFGAVFCLDGFHYLRSKVALVKELARATRREAPWIFPHLHNRKCFNYNAGIPLSPEGYDACFAPIAHRIYREPELLDDFHRSGTLRLDRTASSAELDGTQNLTLIGSQRPDFWRERADLVERLCRDPARLVVNPIYKVARTAATLRLTMSWPTERLRDECKDVEAYLPSTAELDAELLVLARQGKPSAENIERIKELARTFLLVNLPRPAYGSG